MDALLARGRREYGPRARGALDGHSVPAPGRGPTLAEHPAFNAAWDGDAVEPWDAINIGVAIALDDGLIAPALLDCRDRDVASLAAGLADLVARTRAGKLRAAEIGEATFTLSNLGMFDVTQFTAIITPPQVAILATARPSSARSSRDGEVVVRRVMTATLSSDHRVVDGVGAARFLATLKGLAEAPSDWAAVADDAAGRGCRGGHHPAVPGRPVGLRASARAVPVRVRATDGHGLRIPR